MRIVNTREVVVVWRRAGCATRALEMQRLTEYRNARRANGAHNVNDDCEDYSPVERASLERQVATAMSGTRRATWVNERSNMTQ